MALQNSQRVFLDGRDPPAKEAILKASLELFVRDGVAETSVRDIAKASGYTNPALFRHFESKDALAYYLYERIFMHVRASLPKIDDASFADQMRKTFAAYLALIDDDIEATLYYQENTRRFWPQLPAAHRRHSLVRHMQALLKCGVVQRAIDPQEDLTLLVAGLLGLIGQFVRMFYFREFVGPARDRLDDMHRLAMRIAGSER
jgi:AcrR family transcriptional regulator